MVKLFNTGTVDNAPPILKMHHMCKNFNTLPSSGGLLNQPDKLMEGFFIIDQLLLELKEQKRKGADNFG